MRPECVTFVSATTDLEQLFCHRATDPELSNCSSMRMLCLQKAKGERTLWEHRSHLGLASTTFFRHITAWGKDYHHAQKTRRTLSPGFYWQNNSIHFPNSIKETLPGVFHCTWPSSHPKWALNLTYNDMKLRACKVGPDLSQVGV